MAQRAGVEEIYCKGETGEKERKREKVMARYISIFVLEGLWLAESAGGCIFHDFF